MSKLMRRDTYLFQKGNFSLSNFKFSSCIRVQNTEWDIVEWVTGSVKHSIISCNKTNDNNLEKKNRVRKWIYNFLSSTT